MELLLMMRFRAVLPWLVLVQCSAGSGFAQKIEAKVVGREVIQQRLTQISGKNPERKARLQQLFAEAGAADAQMAEEEVAGSRLPNLVCTLPGSTDATIIVGAHYDANFDYGQGIVDNWSGASLLPSLFESVKAYPRRHTFIFVGFVGEEKGLVGSRYYVRKLPKERKNATDAMVNLDCLGMTSTKVDLGKTGGRMGSVLNGVANAMKLPVSVVDVSRVGISDANAFAEAKIPSLTVHSVTQDNFSVLHSLKDRLQLVHTDDYYDTYRLVAFYLAALDSLLRGAASATETR
jgi:Zn-dependent M28 family amino/carboxypeptidase